MIELYLGEIGSHCAITIGGILHSQDDEIALVLVIEVLSGIFVNVCSPSVFNIQSLKTLTDEIGQFGGINPFEIHSFGTIESQIIGVFSVFPVGSHEDGVLAWSQVDFEIEVSGSWSEC